MLKPPLYWQRKGGVSHPVARLMLPVAGVYDWLGKRRRRSVVPYTAQGPVICVGNVSMGGVGKTPFALMLAELLKSQKIEPAFLTRGYGGKRRGPIMISADHTFPDIGDEALLLRQFAPVCVSADRAAGARMVFEQCSADVLIMDDGYQNPALKKDMSFLLIDAETGFGNGAVFPAGPLREMPSDAIDRAVAVVFVIPHKEFTVPSDLMDFAGEKPVLLAWLEPRASSDTARHAVAFCGIGRPAKFYRSAAASGYNVAATKGFPDHYAYTETDIARLRQLARTHEAVLLTTEKDYVRVPPQVREEIETLPVRMRVDKEQFLIDLLMDATGKSGRDG